MNSIKKRLTSILCALLFLMLFLPSAFAENTVPDLSPYTAEELYQSGYTLYQQGNYGEAAALLQEAADRGHTKAQG